jgi:peptide/nickel transport system substrate-binding protein
MPGFEKLTSKVSRRTILKTSAAGAAVSLLAAGGTVAAAASGSQPGAATTHLQDAGTPTPTPPTPKPGGTIIYNIGQEGSHLVPSFSSFSTVIEPTVPFFSGLTRPGINREPTPDLAESWTANADGTNYVFKLREGVTWHDGQPFTSADVKFTWELIANPKNTTAAQLYSFFSKIVGADDFHTGKATEITGIKATDDLTIDVTLASPWAPFLTIAANQYIVPRHILGDIAVDKILESDYARAPIGTGPFTFKAWQAGDSIIGEAFENYYGGRPYADTVVLRVAGLDANGELSALDSGELNASDLTLVQLDTLKGDSAVQTIEPAGQANQYVEFNLAKPLFQDVNVRKALSYALDRNAISQAVWQGRAKIYNSVFPYDWWCTKKDTTIFDNDVDQARKLLDAAGWTVGSDGIREKDGTKFSFTAYSISPDWSLVVQQQWKAIGIDVKLQMVDFPTLSTQYYTTHIFDVVFLNIPYTLYTDPHYALPGYFLSANNRNAYKNPKSDELIIAAASTNDQEKRKELYYEWQELIAQDVPHLWIGNPDAPTAYSTGLYYPQQSSSFFTWRRIHDWYWTE